MFSGTAHAAVTLTLFTKGAFTSAGDGSIWTSFSFTSYQEIPSGSTLHLKPSTSTSQQIPDVIGSAPFALQNYDDSSTPGNALVITDGTSGTYDVLVDSSNVYAGSTFSSQLRLRSDPSKILVTTYRHDIPVYQWLNAVKPGEAVAVSFDSFLPSQTIPVNKQIALASVKTMAGSNFANGYDFCEYYSRLLSNSSNLSALPKLGYLDGFEKYYVSAVLNPLDAKNNLYYSKAGTIPQSITLPDFTFAVTNDNLYDLSLTFSNDYSYKQATFIQSNTATQTTWTLNASNLEAFKAPSIPSEIKKLYPTLNADGLKLEFASYTHCLDGYTYPEYVSDMLRNTPRNVYEELRYVDIP